MLGVKLEMFWKNTDCYAPNYMLVHTKCQLKRDITITKLIRFFFSKVNQLMYCTSQAQQAHQVSKHQLKLLSRYLAHKESVTIWKKDDRWTNDPKAICPSEVGSKQSAFSGGMMHSLLFWNLQSLKTVKANCLCSDKTGDVESWHAAIIHMCLIATVTVSRQAQSNHDSHWCAWYLCSGYQQYAYCW